MLAKVLIIGAVAAVALAIEYPEGIDPAVCPNYPFCDEPIPQYNYPYAAARFISYGYRTPLHPALCPNFPHCDPEVMRRHTPEGIPIPEWELAAANAPFANKYPPGVDPAVCPNYPFCDMEALARYTREAIPSTTTNLPPITVFTPTTSTTAKTTW